jgi:hypothetical protein
MVSDSPSIFITFRTTLVGTEADKVALFIPKNLNRSIGIVNSNVAGAISHMVVSLAPGFKQIMAECARQHGFRKDV